MPEKKKMEQDYGPIVQAKLPEIEKKCQKQLAEGIEEALNLEKQARLAEDVESTTKVATFIISMCHQAKDWKALNENLVILSKRRAQHKQAIQGIVGQAVGIVEKLADVGEELEIKLQLIDTVRTIAEGKIFVENERARLTRKLAQIKEAEGKIKEASDILQDIQVETYGAMEKREKIDFILEQMRLCLDCKELIRTFLVSRKINTKVLSEEGFQDLKLRYYHLMIRYYFHEKNFLEVSRSWQAIYDTPQVKNSPQQRAEALTMIVVHLVLAVHDPEQHDTILRVFADKNLLELQPYHALLKYFLTQELIQWSKFEGLYRNELHTLAPFKGPEAPKLWEELHNRVIQHNIRVIAQYYTKLTTKRFSQLLDLSPELTEKFLSDLVTSKAVYAKIDRPKGVVVFNKPLDAGEVLNDWSSNISSLLNLMEKTCHLIQRENMVYLEKAQAEESK